MTGKEAMLQAFDRLFDRAATKLHVECSPEEKEAAKRQFDPDGIMAPGFIQYQ